MLIVISLRACSATLQHSTTVPQSIDPMSSTKNTASTTATLSDLTDNITLPSSDQPQLAGYRRQLDHTRAIFHHALQSLCADSRLYVTLFHEWHRFLGESTPSQELMSKVLNDFQSMMDVERDAQRPVQHIPILMDRQRMETSFRRAVWWLINIIVDSREFAHNVRSYHLPEHAVIESRRLPKALRR